MKMTYLSALLLLLANGATAAGLLPLPQLVNDAVQSHPLVGARRQEQLAAEQMVNAAKLQYWPAPSVTSDRLNGHQSTVFRLTQTVWDGGKLDADLDGARLRAAKAGLDITETQFGLALRMVELYQSWLAQVGRREAQERGVRKLEELVAMIERRSQSGVSAKIDVDLVHARLEQARGDLLAIQSGEQSALAQLARNRGSAIPEGALVRAAVQPLPGTLPQLLEQAARRHPSVQRAAVDARIARNEVRQAGAARFPSISLRAEQQMGALPGSGQEGNRVLLSVNYAPGAGLSAHAVAKAAVNRAEAAEQAVESTRRDLADRTESAWLELKSAHGRLASLDLTSRHSTEVLASSQRLFTTGRRSWLDLLNAVRELMQAEQSESDATASAVGAHYRLRLLAGEAIWLNQGASNE